MKLIPTCLPAGALAKVGTAMAEPPVPNPSAEAGGATPLPLLGTTGPTGVTLREGLRRSALALASRGVFVGTSSWKYPGWLGQLYHEDRYWYRGRFAETRFERQCLAEYAEVFPTVCVDAAYYRFPDPRFLDGLMAPAPATFQFTFKVTDEITVKRFSNLPRFGARAGQANENFLNAELFVSQFLRPCEPVKDRIGLLMFEFSRFYPADFARGREFVEALDGFLARLPRGWRYGVEIRNRGFLRPEYFAMLARHGVAHVFNSWEAMPSLAEQFALPGCFPQPEFAGARLLLKPGREYQEAVDQFAPYDRIQDPYPEGREAAAEAIRRVAMKDSRAPRTLYLYVNNRFEGNALQTIAAMMTAAGWWERDAGV